MDERQTQIKEGAGLDESRLNQDFIELLRKWSTPVLLVFAIVAFSFYGVQQWTKLKVGKVNDAFISYENARKTGATPREFIAISEIYGGTRAVGLMARIDAADGFVQSVLSGIMPGFMATVDGPIVYLDGSALDEDNPPQTLMTEADRDSYLSQAETIYQAVIAETEEEEGTRIFALSASFGLAAVAESRGDADQAKAALERTAAMAEQNGFGAHAAIAKTRIESLGELADRPVLFETDLLPVIEEPEVVIPSTIDAGVGPVPEVIEGAADPADEGAGEAGTGENTEAAGGEADPTAEGAGEGSGEGAGEENAEKTGEEEGEGGGEESGQSSSEGGGEKEGGEGGGGSPAP